MSDITDSSSERLSRLFALYNERLVRALRARLGRYHWDLAEELAAGTWLRAVQRSAGQLRFTSNEQAFEWLSWLAWSVQGDHFRQLREIPMDFAGARAYKLPSFPAAEDVALELLGEADLVAGYVAGFESAPAPLGVAA